MLTSYLTGLVVCGGIIIAIGATLSPWLAKPKAWRFIDGIIGAMMAAIAIHLASNGL